MRNRLFNWFGQGLSTVMVCSIFFTIGYIGDTVGQAVRAAEAEEPRSIALPPRGRFKAGEQGILQTRMHVYGVLVFEDTKTGREYMLLRHHRDGLTITPLLPKIEQED